MTLGTRKPALTGVPGGAHDSAVPASGSLAVQEVEDPCEDFLRPRGNEHGEIGRIKTAPR